MDTQALIEALREFIPATEQCGMIIDLLCGRSCLDALGRLAVGSNITPSE